MCECCNIETEKVEHPVARSVEVTIRRKRVRAREETAIYIRNNKDCFPYIEARYCLDGTRKQTTMLPINYCPVCGEQLVQFKE